MSPGNNIIRQVKEGDKAAFKTLVESNQKQAFSLAFRILCDEEEARDVVQESFISIWTHIKTFDEKAKFSTWMHRIVTNRAIDRLRSLKRRKHVSLEEVEFMLDDILLQDSSSIADNRDLGKIIGFISRGLPEKQRIIFILRDIQGMDSQEVQEVLELSESSVKSNLYHARQAVKEKLTRLIQYERREP